MSLQLNEILLLKMLVDREIQVSLSFSENETIPEEFRSAAKDYSTSSLRQLRDKLENMAEAL